MAIITLTTDFGEKDHFAGAIKGAVYSELPDVKIVDISHSVSPFNIPEAAYIIRNAFESFPKGTIHMIGIDSEINQENKHIAIKLDGHYFVCAVKVACHIARGGTLEVIGKPISTIKPIKDLVPYVNDEKTQMIGSIIYIDNYGNVVTNITKKFFEDIQKGRSYEISARNYKFKTIYKKYSDIVNFDIPEDKRNDEGRGLVVFNASNYLEIAVYKSNSATVGSASTLMGLQLRDTITINFTK